MFALGRLTARRKMVTALAAIALIAGKAASQPLSLPSESLGGGAERRPVTSGSTSGVVGAPDAPIVVASDGAPSSMFASGSVYNPTLGSHIRVQLNTESYGQAEGNFNIGTMKLWDVDGGVLFVDGQVTLNDESRVGYNVGAGYRWLTLPLFPNSPDNEKIMGVSFWSDGQGADGEHFFTQVGTSLEFLGDQLDFRANGYAVVGDRTKTRDITTTGELDFTGFNFGEETAGVLDTALTVAEAELARRIADVDAWVFGGVYGFAGGGFEEVGGKIGVRGYLTPDLNLSVALTHDELFETNGVMRLTWFIGRTRRENYPTGSLRDRFREPVIRNDYIAIAESRVTGAGTIATDPTDDEAIRVVHIDENAADGGDGSAEAPFNSLDDVSGTMEGDILLVHADTTPGGAFTMLDDQTLVGEGGGVPFAVATNEFGTVNLPETSPGALDGAIPVITNTGAETAVTLADDNTVTNLAFAGGARAIASDTTLGSLNPSLNNLTISGASGAAIDLASVDAVDADDIDGDADDTEMINLLGTVAISDVTFEDNLGQDIAINGATAIADDEAQTQTISITGVMSDRNLGAQSVAITNTIAAENSLGAATSSITITDYVFDADGAASGGALDFQVNSAPISITNTRIDGGSGPGINVVDALSSVTIGADVADASAPDIRITDVDGAAIQLNGYTGAVTIQETTITGDAALTNGEGIVATGAGGTTTGTLNIGASGAPVAITDVAGTSLEIDGVNGAVAFDNGSSITGGGTTGAAAVRIVDTAEDGDVSIGATATITDVAALAVEVDNTLGSVTVDADLVNADTVTGGGVSVDQNAAPVTFGGVLTTNNANAVTINANQATVAISGDITSAGTGDTVTITNSGLGTTDPVDITISGNITNTDAGRVVVISGGDDTILFGGGPTAATISDTGAGMISITGRNSDTQTNDSLVNFLSDVNLTTPTGNSVFLSGNVAESIVNFGELAITNNDNAATSALFSAATSEEQLNVAGGSITTDMGATAISLTDGSSATGVTFDTVDVTGGAASNAVLLTDFDGTVTINGGDVATTDLAFDIDDTGLVLFGVSIDSANDMAIDADYSVADLGVSVTGTIFGSGDPASFNGGTVDVSSTADGGVDLRLSDIADVGGIVAMDAGAGAADVSILNVVSTGTVDFDSSGDGTAALTITGGEHTSVTADASNNDTFTTTINGTTTLTTGGVAVTATNNGTFTTNVSGVTATGAGAAFTATANNTTDNASVTLSGSTLDDDLSVSGNAAAGTLTVDFDNVTSNNGDVLLTATNGGAFTAELDGIEATNGVFTANANNTSGNASVDVATSEFDGAVTINATNPGNLTATATSVTSNNGGLTVDAGAGNATTDVNITGGSYAGDILVDAKNTGSLDVDVIGGTDAGAFTVTTTGDVTNAAVDVASATFTGDMTVTAVNTGTLDVGMTGNTTANAFTVTTTAAVGDTTVNVAGGSYTDAMSITGANTGDFAATLTGVTSTSGLTIAASNVGTGDATVSVTGGDFSGPLDFDFTNVTDVDFTLSTTEVATAADVTAVSLFVGGGVDGGNFRITDNASITTNDGIGVEADFEASSGAIAFLFDDNNITNNGANASSDTAIVDIGNATVDATITNNVFTNLNAGGPDELFVQTSDAGSALDLLLQGNTANSGGAPDGDGTLLIREEQGEIEILDLADTFNNVAGRNTPAPTFLITGGAAAVIGDFAEPTDGAVTTPP